MEFPPRALPLPWREMEPFPGKSVHPLSKASKYGSCLSSLLSVPENNNYNSTCTLMKNTENQYIIDALASSTQSDYNPTQFETSQDVLHFTSNV